MVDEVFAIPAMNNAVLNLQETIRQNSHIRGGRKSLIANRETHITRLDGQTDPQFEAMVKMAPIYILYPKIVDGFSGTIFSKPPSLVGIDEGDSTKNVDMLGNSIHKISEKITNNVLENGFCATINDYSDIADKPFIRFIKPDQFVSFRSNSDKGYPEISQFIYKETKEIEDEDNEFNSKEQVNFIVLDIFDGNYRSRTFVETSESGGEMRMVGDEVFPKIGGKTFDRIPVEIHGLEPNNFTIDKSPLQDLSDMNISIIQRVIDQVYMLHWTALPTPYVIGVDDDEAPTTIGPSIVWHIPNYEAKVGMLEFSGQSAKAHQDFVDNLKEIMAITGAQILKKEGVSRETATSVLIRTAAQTSLVATLVKNLSSQIQRIFKTHLEWSGIAVGDDYEYKLNSDFIRVDMEPNAMIALVKSWIDGAISHKTMFKKMKEGEIVSSNKSFEDEISEIKANPPPFYQLNIQSENALKLKEKEGLTGSNLENGNVANRQATEQA